ncbi:MAG: hypothetical protein EOO11_15600, partial [Chitinophagaceae bacterium]
MRNPSTLHLPKHTQRERTMNVLVLTNNCASLPSLELLAGRQQLSAVYAPLPATPETQAISDWAAARSVPFFWIGKDLLEEELAYFTGEFADHLVLSFGFPWKIPARLLSGEVPRFFNVHFSLLPAYAGPTPLFWQLRDGCTRGGVTLHRITATLDGGPIAGQAAVTLLPGENAGLYSSRLAAAAVPLIRNLADTLTRGEVPDLKPQALSERSYQRRPGAEDLEIDWSRHSAAFVEALVNAANPVAGGALAFFRGIPVRILEVTPADGSIPAGTAGGTIIHSDAAQGLFVTCAD